MDRLKGAESVIDLGRAMWSSSRLAARQLNPLRSLAPSRTGGKWRSTASPWPLLEPYAEDACS